MNESLPILLFNNDSKTLSWAILEGSEEEDNEEYYNIYDFSSNTDDTKSIPKNSTDYRFIIPSPLNIRPQHLTKAIVRKVFTENELFLLENDIDKESPTPIEFPQLELGEKVHVIDLCPDYVIHDGWCKVFSPDSKRTGLYPIVYLEFEDNF